MSRADEFEVAAGVRVKPYIHPEHQLVGDLHYDDPKTAAWVERIPPTEYRTGGHKTPRWRVGHIRGNEQGGSMQTATTYLRTRRDALEAFEMVKGGKGIHEAENAVIQARKDRQRERRDERRHQRFKGYNQAMNSGSFG